MPEYLLFVNHAELLTRTYERFLENRIREEYPMEGLPFVFEVKSRVSETKENRNLKAKAAGPKPETAAKRPARRQAGRKRAVPDKKGKAS